MDQLRLFDPGPPALRLAEAYGGGPDRSGNVISLPLPPGFRQGGLVLRDPPEWGWDRDDEGGDDAA